PRAAATRRRPSPRAPAAASPACRSETGSEDCRTWLFEFPMDALRADAEPAQRFLGRLVHRQESRGLEESLQRLAGIGIVAGFQQHLAQTLGHGFRQTCADDL